MPKIRKVALMPKHQPNATLSQANPVQNTWYSLLPTTYNCRLLNATVKVADTNETLEMRIIIDGVTYTATLAATAGTANNAYLGEDGVLYIFTGAYASSRAFMFEGRSISIDVRKTTAAGAGTITGNACFAKW